MDSIKQTSALVKTILEAHEKARNSDNFLYYLVCKAKLEKAGVDINNISFCDGLLLRKEYRLPKFETVRRARQKVQQRHPELAAHENVVAERELNEEKYKDFARGVL